MIATAMVIGALLLCAPVPPAQVDGQEATQWARIVALDGGTAIRATLTPPKYLLERGFLSPDGEARRPDDRRLDGRFIAADADTLVLRVVAGGDKGAWRIPRAAIAGIDAVEATVDQTGDGYLKGLALGAGLGLTTYIGFSGSSDAFDVDELPYLMAPPALAWASRACSTPTSPICPTASSSSRITRATAAWASRCCWAAAWTSCWAAAGGCARS